MPNGNRRTIRNPVAQSAILRKGGVHDKSTKAKRQKNKQALKRQLRQGRADRPFLWLLICSWIGSSVLYYMSILHKREWNYLRRL